MRESSNPKRASAIKLNTQIRREYGSEISPRFHGSNETIATGNESLFHKIKSSNVLHKLFNSSFASDVYHAY